MATLTIRLIKSFEYRTTKNLILHDIDLSITTEELEQIILQKVREEPQFKVYKTVPFDTLKIYFLKHGNKSQNLIINLDDHGYLTQGKSLTSQGIENETEISYFNRELYTAFKQNPNIKW
jgi:hypothetical protein